MTADASSSVWTRRAAWTIPPVTLVAIACLALGVALDRRLPLPAEWKIMAVLGAVAVVAAVVERRYGPPDEESTPPWSVHTVWLLPAALLAPPLAYLPLLAFSVILSLTRHAHGLPTRLVVASTTIITTVEIHWMAQVFDRALVAGLLGIAAQYVTGLVLALLAASVFTGPTGTAIWLDYRWSFVQLGCGFAGLLTATAVTLTPLAGFAALAPVLMAVFTLHWPELDRRARIDGKTGLPNAQHWDDRSRDLISAAALHDTPVAVAIIDIDHFKAVNDTYGHLVGDAVLQAFANTIRSQLSPGDLVGRFGGEEFVVTLFGLPAEQVTEVAERIRIAVAGQLHDGRSRRVAAATGSGPTSPAAAFSITCTIGLATSYTSGFDLSELLKAADDALAAGKRAGRNRVQVAAGGVRGAVPDGMRHGGFVGEIGEMIRTANDKLSWIHVANQQRATRRGEQQKSD